MMKKPPQVLIVGAGPSGLMMAHELMRYGIRPRIIEKELKKSPYSRAIGVQIRTLEIFKALGLYEKLIAKAQTVSAMEIYAENRKPVRIDIENTHSEFIYPHIIDETHTEQVLEEAVENLGLHIERGVELIKLVKENDHVVAHLNENGEESLAKFSYVIGADGAHSIVRKSMTNQFLGSAYDDAFILVDAICKTDKAPDSFRVFFKDKLFLAMIPMHGEDHYRLISVRRNDLKKEGPNPTIEEFEGLVKKLLPFPFEISKSIWVSRFFVQCRSARYYQEDRLFLVGDSAHIHSPAGGQGMNTGLQDSFNLAWKIFLTLEKKAHPSLLESYQLERKPVGDFLIERTDRLFKFMVKSSIWARLLRRLVLPKIAKSHEMRQKFFSVLSQTAIHYKDGAICEDEEHLSLGDFKVGKRASNFEIITSRLKKSDLHTLTSVPYFTFLLLLPKNVDKKVVKTAATLKSQFEHFHKAHLLFASDFDAEDLLVEDYWIVHKPSWPITEASYVILRPDNHVFCLGLLSEIEHGKNSLEKYMPV